jgi:hypothetical protein
MSSVPSIEISNCVPGSLYEGHGYPSGHPGHDESGDDREGQQRQETSATPS